MAATTSDLQIVQVPIDDLHPYPANPRKISYAELDASPARCESSASFTNAVSCAEVP
jgi:hypothetical protein